VMSYQSQIPILSQPPPPVAPAAKGKRHRGLLILGLLLLLGGLIGGGAIVTKGMSNYKEAVKSLARAPVGCTTTLVFDKPATFTVYTETKGKLGELSGDCKANGTEYNHPGDSLPKVSLILKGPNGDEVDMQRGATATYDVGGYVGHALRSLNIEQAGTYRLDVESDETNFAVAIGKNPKSDNDKWMAIGGGVALGGLVLGLLFMLLGLRRRRPEAVIADVGYTATAMPGWPPGPYWGAPPAAPPAPPSHPGFRPEPPPGPQPIRLPGQPPIRLPDQPPTAVFAPPTFAPPAPPAPSDGPPVSPPPAPPSAGPPPAPLGTGWEMPDKPTTTRNDDDD
jgi:hypothetical protein